MSKTKEQCLNIISKEFSNIGKNGNIKNSLFALEKSIKEIVDAEYSLVWKYDALNNKIINKDKVLLLGESILGLILKNKKVFFDNHVSSHKNYNKIIDNPLDIKIKSMIILPILKNKEEIIGFLVAYNSMAYASEFQRYDTRSISLLRKHGETLLEASVEKNPRKNPTIVKVKPIQRSKKEVVLKKTVKAKSNKKDLEKELEAQSKKIKELEALLLKEKKPKQELIVAEEVSESSAAHENYKELKSIIDFLKNELSYFSEKQNSVYTFLEVIKNSLHNKEQFEYIEKQLKASQLVNSFVDTLQNKEYMPINIEVFKSYQSLLSVVGLYSKVFLEEELFFNVFIDPKIPSELLGDIEKIQSLMVHLFNNINCLSNRYGRVECSVEYNEEKAVLELIVKSLPPLETKTFFDFFKKKKVTNSLTSNNSGLGLSVVSNLIKILNGKLKLTTEKNGEHSFMVSVPCSLPKSKKKSDKVFKAKKPLKIAILMSADDEYAYYNLRRYLDGFGISKDNIMVITNYKKLEGKKLSHLFCFEDMLSDKIDVSKIPSISVLRYSAIVLEYDSSVTVNELYLNSYYGMSLQKILFPSLAIEEIDSNTVLLECNHIHKNKEKKNEGLISYVGQLRGFNS